MDVYKHTGGYLKYSLYAYSVALITRAIFILYNHLEALKSFCMEVGLNMNMVKDNKVVFSLTKRIK